MTFDQPGHDIAVQGRVAVGPTEGSWPWSRTRWNVDPVSPGARDRAIVGGSRGGSSWNRFVAGFDGRPGTPPGRPQGRSEVVGDELRTRRPGPTAFGVPGPRRSMTMAAWHRLVQRRRRSCLRRQPPPPTQTANNHKLAAGDRPANTIEVQTRVRCRVVLHDECQCHA